jgi:hypothetical protein
LSPPLASRTHYPSSSPSPSSSSSDISLDRSPKKHPRPDLSVRPPPQSPIPSQRPSPLASHTNYPLSPPSSFSTSSDISLDRSPKKHPRPDLSARPPPQSPIPPRRPSTPLSDAYHPPQGTPAPDQHEPQFPQNISMSGKYAISHCQTQGN